MKSFALLAGMKALGIVLSFFAFGNCFLDGELCPRKHRALLIALLPLHKGNDCRELVQKGIQQKLALETALDKINEENDLQIGMKIFDTCSSKEKAVESALKGMAYAEKRCSKYPIFLGFLGPDDEESMKYLIDTLNYTHVVPGLVQNFHQYKAISVEVIDSVDRSERLISFLKYVNWYSFILLFTSDTVSTRMALSLLETDDFCLVNSVLKLPSFGSKKNFKTIKKLRRVAEGADNIRLVIITDDADVMDYFTDYVEDDWGEMEYIVYLQNVGIFPWRSSNRMLRNSIILQEVLKAPLLLPGFDDTIKNSTLWARYSSQACNGCEDGRLELDRTLIPYIYSLRLYSRALTTVIRRKCGMVLLCDALKATNQTEWRSILEDTVTVADTSTIRFYMTLEFGVDVFVSDDNSSFKIAGTINPYLSIRRPEMLKRSNRSREKQCFVDLYEHELEPEPEVTTAEKEEEEEDDDPIVEGQRVLLNFGYNELMATVIGFPIVLILLISLTIICAHKSSKRDGEKMILDPGTREDCS